MHLVFQECLCYQWANWPTTIYAMGFWHQHKEKIVADRDNRGTGKKQDWWYKIVHVWRVRLPSYGTRVIMTTMMRPRNVARKSVRFRNMRSYELLAAKERKPCLPSLTNYLQLIYVFATSTRKEKLKTTPRSKENNKTWKRKGLKCSHRPLPINRWTMMYPRTSSHTNDLLHDASRFQQDISPV